MERAHLDPSQHQNSVVDGSVRGNSPGLHTVHTDPNLMSQGTIGLHTGGHAGSQHSPAQGLAGSAQPANSYNWRSFQNPIGKIYHDPNPTDDRWGAWGAGENQGNVTLGSNYQTEST